MAEDGFLDEPSKRLSARIRRGEVSVSSVVRASLDRIATRDPDLHAFVTVFDQKAEHRARELDAELAQGHWRGPLHGLPVAVKDLADIEGAPTGFGSRCYAQGRARRNARFVDTLLEAGAIIIGKTQTVEFAYGSWGTNHALGTPVNPSVAGHAVPGGSSSGSAVAVAAGLVPLAVGSDTGGSVRIPAALCGVAGMKPSHGLIPLDGVAPLSPALDTIGPLARDVAGLRLLLRGLQPDWSETATSPANAWTLCDADLEPIHPDILAAYRAQVAELNARGLATAPLPLPRPLGEYQRFCGDIMAHDAFAALEPLVTDRRLPMDPFVRRRIGQGAAIGARDHADATQRRAQDIEDFLDRFGPRDVLFLPATPLPPCQVAEIDESEIPMSRFTRIANYLDLCAVTVPLCRSGPFPIGMQLVAQSGQDDMLLSALSPGRDFGHLS